jgi:hypothetical protein
MRVSLGFLLFSLGAILTFGQKRECSPTPFFSVEPSVESCDTNRDAETGETPPLQASAYSAHCHR